MDNFFEILIFLFIIISFFSSLFKKKNKGEENTPPASSPQQPVKTEQNRTDTSTQNYPQYQQDENDADILKEIEAMFKGYREEEVQETNIPQRDPSEEKTRMEKKQAKTKLEEEGHYSGEWHKPIETEHTPTTSEHTFTTDWEKEKEKVSRKTKRIDSQVRKQAEKMEKILKQKDTYESSLVKDVRSKLKNPASIKEYIVVSEIIGKPKAFSE